MNTDRADKAAPECPVCHGPCLLEETRCEVCGARLDDGACPNDSDSNHDRIQNELWEEQGVFDNE